MKIKLSEKINARPDYVEEVYRILLGAISDGSLAPGTRITQEEIAEQLNVSRSPILQAIRLLKKDGLLVDAQGRGVMVTPLDAEKIAHLFQLRSALEVLATRLATQKKSVIPKHLIEQGSLAAKSDDINLMIDADEAFHKAIYHASGNPLIAKTAQIHWAHLRRVMGLVLQSKEQRLSVWVEHKKLAEAIQTGDVKAAVSFCEDHMNNASQKLLTRLREVLMNPLP